MRLAILVVLSITCLSGDNPCSNKCLTTKFGCKVLEVHPMVCYNFLHLGRYFNIGNCLELSRSHPMTTDDGVTCRFNSRYI